MTVIKCEKIQPPLPPVDLPPAEYVLTLTPEAAEELFHAVGGTAGGEHLYTIYQALKRATGLDYDGRAINKFAGQYKYVPANQRK